MYRTSEGVIQVAKGIVEKSGPETIYHWDPIEEGTCVVVVRSIEQGRETLMVPYPTETIVLLKSALNVRAIWPSDLVILDVCI